MLKTRWNRTDKDDTPKVVGIKLGVKQCDRVGWQPDTTHTNRMVCHYAVYKCGPWRATGPECAV